MATYPIQFVDQLRQHLRALRKKRGLTQARLGQLLGVSQSRIAEIEANPGAVTLDKLIQVLSILDVSFALVDIAEPADIPTGVGEPAPSSYEPASQATASHAVAAEDSDDALAYPGPLPRQPDAVQHRILTDYARTLNTSFNAETSKLHAIGAYDRLSEQLRAAHNILKENESPLLERVRQASRAGATAAQTRADLERLRQRPQVSGLTEALERFREQTIANKVEASPPPFLPYKKKGSW